jgi:hypothetical protein
MKTSFCGEEFISLLLKKCKNEEQESSKRSNANKMQSGMNPFLCRKNDTFARKRKR